jgi:hypothetical protein
MHAVSIDRNNEIYIIKTPDISAGRFVLGTN